MKQVKTILLMLQIAGSAFAETDCDMSDEYNEPVSDAGEQPVRGRGIRRLDSYMTFNSIPKEEREGDKAVRTFYGDVIQGGVVFAVKF